MEKCTSKLNKFIAESELTSTTETDFDNYHELIDVYDGPSNNNVQQECRSSTSTPSNTSSQAKRKLEHLNDRKYYNLFSRHIVMNLCLRSNVSKSTVKKD